VYAAAWFGCNEMQDLNCRRASLQSLLRAWSGGRRRPFIRFRKTSETCSSCFWPGVKIKVDVLFGGVKPFFQLFHISNSTPGSLSDGIAVAIVLQIKQYSRVFIGWHCSGIVVTNGELFHGAIRASLCRLT
jgi:hypothetical protein